MGLSQVAKAVVFEKAGYSWLGPTALNIHAPDEGEHPPDGGGGDAAVKSGWLALDFRLTATP